MVHQNRIQPGVGEVFVRVDLAVVAEDIQVSAGVQNSVSEAPLEGSYVFSPAAIQRTNVIGFRAHGKLLECDIVRPAEADNARPVGSDLEAGDNHVVVPALESRDQAVPLILDKLRWTAQDPADGPDHVHLEANQLARISRILKFVGSAAFGVCSPCERPSLTCLPEST